MRPELPQSVVDPDAAGEVRIFHTNAWLGQRRGGGSLGRRSARRGCAENALQTVLDRLARECWDISSETTKILMLTHSALAGRQGYPSIPHDLQPSTNPSPRRSIRISPTSPTSLEPACEAYERSQKYGEMFRALGSSVPAIRTHDDKHQVVRSHEQAHRAERRRDGRRRAGPSCLRYAGPGFPMPSSDASANCESSFRSLTWTCRAR